jgi:serine/threonine protein kinase
MNFADFVGQTLDDKYKIERELGRGGMGTVYLATHLGTERPVAVKIIAPQFMQRAEFVERFRREARAAGRLRHPNVVDVTDFGFSDTSCGQVAYLVMEYLDGCTLGEILEEEKNLPVGWTLDIIEQVCSAVHEAHEQGIIHRDLKPDNIWLEPNQRGGYTVKVLDFGIAKLEEHMVDAGAETLAELPPFATRPGAGRETVAIIDSSGTAVAGLAATQFGDQATIAQNGEPGTHAGDAATMAGESGTLAIGSDTFAGEAGTLIQPSAGGDDKKTAILAPLVSDGVDAAGTKLITEDTEREATARTTPARSLAAQPGTAELTRVGAVLGTPLYMSPEQCRGEKLDARSDIYSLAVITYQMLGGRTPFEGDYKDVMEAHKNLPPPPLVAKKVRKKIKNLIYAGLAKDTTGRPLTAEAFACELRAQSEGIGTLLRRAMTLYSEYLPKFLGLAVLLYIPAILLTLLNVVVSILSVTGVTVGATSIILKVVFTALMVFAIFFCTHMIGGTTTWLVNQILAFPLRPVNIRPALDAMWKKWKKLIGTGFLAAVVTTVGWALCIIPGLFAQVLLLLVAPVVMMENLKGITAFKRSKQLVMRSIWTSIATMLILVCVPAFIGGLTSFVTAVTVKAFTQTPEKVMVNADGEIVPFVPKEGQPAGEANGDNIDVNFGNRGVIINGSNDNGDKMMKQVRAVVQESSSSILMLPFQILIASLSSIIGALLYLKTRQAGGESLRDLFQQFEEADRPRKKWQERVRQRLIQSGRITSKSGQ